MPGKRFSTRAPSRSGASCTASETTVDPASRGAGWDGRWAPTSTGPFCRATRGSPTGCSRRHSRTQPAARHRRSSRSTTSSRAPRSASPPTGLASAAAAADSGRPHLAEVRGGVSRLPALQEAVNRWMEWNCVELAHEERAVTVYGVILRDDVLERPADVRREDHVDDVLAVRVGGRRDGIDDRDRPLERNLLPAGEEPGLLEELASQRRDEALPHAHSSAGKQPHLTGRLLVAQQMNAPLSAQDRRNPDPRLHQRLNSPMTRILASLARSRPARRPRRVARRPPAR